MAKMKKNAGKEVSSDTDITYANNSGLNIAGDLMEFDTNNWNADAYLIGGSVDGNSPFNIYEINSLKNNASGFLAGDDLQSK